MCVFVNFFKKLYASGVCTFLYVDFTSIEFKKNTEDKSGGVGS